MVVVSSTMTTLRPLIDALDGMPRLVAPDEILRGLEMGQKPAVDAADIGEIAVESLGVPRRASVGELLRFGPFTRVIPLQTRGALLEWEIHSLRVEWAVNRLRTTDLP